MDLNFEDLRLKRTAKILTFIIMLLSFSLVLVACSNDDSSDTDSVNTEETGKSGEILGSEISEQTDSDQAEDDVDKSTVTSASAKIKEMTDCEFMTTALGDFATNYELDNFHFHNEGFSCFYIPPNKTNEETGEDSGYITIIGSYSSSMFEPAEELEKQEIYDVYYDKRVDSFGGVALGINEHDGNDVVTQIKTPDFELSLNVTGDRTDLMYGEPSIDVLLELIEIN